MVFPFAHAYRRVYHFTHIDNLPSLLRTGFLANNHPSFPKYGYRSVAAETIQKRRAAMPVPDGPKGFVHDYVPLYFCSLCPMLLGVINSKNVDQCDILYFEYPIWIIDGVDAVFTDASANTTEAPNFFSDPADLDKLNWQEIDSLKWSCATKELRHQRMAELLIRNQLPLGRAKACVVWNDETKKRVEQLVAAAGVLFPPIEFETPGRYHWFRNFAEGGCESVVTGPRWIARRYKDACDAIAADCGKHVVTATFADLTDLLNGLRENFACLPQTRELVGLRSENGLHKYTVDQHTLIVVANLLSILDRADIKGEPRLIMELAAYLHDIGKGPRSRWDSNGGIQKVDPNHPVKAMPMMVEILTRHVGAVSVESATLLTKLVCYHDLVGDVLGRGRHKQQIIDAAANEGELNMLFALGKADVTSLVEEWWNEDDATNLYRWCLSEITCKTAP